MIVGAHAREQPVGADRVGRGLGEARHAHGVCVGARRLEHEPPQQRAIEVRVLEQREIGRHARQALGEGEEEHRQHDRDERVDAAAERAAADLLRGPAQREAERERREQVRAGDDEDRVVRLVAAPDHAHAERGRGSADEVHEQGVRSPEEPLPADEHGQDHGRDHGYSRIEDHAQDDRGQRHRHELRVHLGRSRGDRRAREHDHEQQGEQA